MAVFHVKRVVVGFDRLGLMLQIVAVQHRAYKRFGLVKHNVVFFDSLRAGLGFVRTGSVVPGSGAGVGCEKADMKRIVL